jgi:hypothetical protein
MAGPGQAPIAAPGTNVKGQVAGGAWTFLLPDDDLGRVLCLGAASDADIATISRMAREVVRGRDAERAARGDFDLVRVAPDAWAALRRAGQAERLGSLLRPGGLAWVEEVRSPRLRPDAPESTLPGLSEIGRYRLWPVRGEIREAAPVADETAIAFVEATRNSGGTARARLIGRLRAWADDRRGQRIGHLLVAHAEAGSIGAGPIGGPPRYLADLAAANGVDLGDRFCLLARGVFNSQKVIVYRFPRADASPDLVVKLPREPALSERLENEHRALERLADLPVATGRVPRPLFFGHHAGLAILGQSVVAGRPFRAAMGRPGGRALLGDAVDFLVELGRATAQRPEPNEQRDRIRWLVDRFIELYRLSDEQRRALMAHIRRLEAGETSVPVVFQHGDPGTWNLLATPDGRAAFLDWEAAEERGVPLWDLAYLLRSYVVTSRRMGGLHRRLDVFAATFIGRSPMSSLVLEAIERYRAAVGLPADLVGPLFLTCWVHRAVKEAGRLPPDRLDTGHYAALVRLCLDRPGPTLERILGPDGMATAGPAAVGRGSLRP